MSVVYLEIILWQFFICTKNLEKNRTLHIRSSHNRPLNYLFPLKSILTWCLPWKYSKSCRHSALGSRSRQTTWSALTQSPFLYSACNSQSAVFEYDCSRRCNLYFQLSRHVGTVFVLYVCLSTNIDVVILGESICFASLIIWLFLFRPKPGHMRVGFEGFYWMYLS